MGTSRNGFWRILEGVEIWRIVSLNFLCIANRRTFLNGFEGLGRAKFGVNRKKQQTGSTFESFATFQVGILVEIHHRACKASNQECTSLCNSHVPNYAKNQNDPLPNQTLPKQNTSTFHAPSRHSSISLPSRPSRRQEGSKKRSYRDSNPGRQKIDHIKI